MNLKSQNVTSKNDNALRLQISTHNSSKIWYTFSKMDIVAMDMVYNLEGSE